MAQIGLHALLGLWIAWALPQFSPYILKFSFGTGIFLGCVLPDVDIYAEVVASFIDEYFAAKLHRTLLHSVITAFFLLLLFVFMEKIIHKKQRNMYDIEAIMDDERMLALSGSDSITPRIDLSIFGIGLFAGMISHIMLDIVFWFSPIDLLYPLSLFDIAQPVNAWTYRPPQVATTILTLSEPFFFAFFFTVLRMSVARKLGKWTDMYPDDQITQRRSFTDNHIEHMSADFSFLVQDDICPLDQKTLSRARPAQRFGRVLIIFQYLYFIALCALEAFISEKRLFQLVYGELMLVCIPAYCYLGFALRDVILRKTGL